MKAENKNNPISILSHHSFKSYFRALILKVNQQGENTLCNIKWSFALFFELKKNIEKNNFYIPKLVNACFNASEGPQGIS